MLFGRDASRKRILNLAFNPSSSRDSIFRSLFIVLDRRKGERGELGEIFQKTHRRRSSRFGTKRRAKTVKSTTENRMLELRNTSRGGGGETWTSFRLTSPHTSAPFPPAPPREKLARRSCFGNNRRRTVSLLISRTATREVAPRDTSPSRFLGSGGTGLERNQLFARHNVDPRHVTVSRAPY